MENEYEDMNFTLDNTHTAPVHPRNAVSSWSCWSAESSMSCCSNIKGHLGGWPLLPYFLETIRLRLPPGLKERRECKNSKIAITFPPPIRAILLFPKLVTLQTKRPPTTRATDPASNRALASFPLRVWHARDSSQVSNKSFQNPLPWQKKDTSLLTHNHHPQQQHVSLSLSPCVCDNGHFCKVCSTLRVDLHNSWSNPFWWILAGSCGVPNLFPWNDVVILQLISFQLLSLIELVTTLLLVIVGVEWYYLKEPTPKM